MASVGLLMGGGVQAVEVRPEAPRTYRGRVRNHGNAIVSGLKPSLAAGSTRAGQGEMSKG